MGVIFGGSIILHFTSENFVLIRPLIDRPLPNRDSPVAPAKRSNSANAKASTKRNADHMPVHSFATLMEDLATVVANRIQPTDTDLPSFIMITKPTPLQQQAFELLGVSWNLGCM